MIFMWNPAQVFSFVLMINIFSFSQSIFVSSCHTTVLVRTYLVGTSIELVEATGVMWCTPERVGYQDEDLFPWVLDLEFTLLNSSKFHNAFLSTHTLLCHYLYGSCSVLVEDFLYQIHFCQWIIFRLCLYIFQLTHL